LATQRVAFFESHLARRMETLPPVGQIELPYVFKLRETEPVPVFFREFFGKIP